MTIFLAIEPRRAAVIVCRDASDIDLLTLSEPLGGFPVELYRIGLAHPATPPGPLLIGDVEELNRLRPLGGEI